MKKIISFSMIFLFLAAFIAISGCTKTEYVYVCADGSEKAEKSECSFNKIAGVKKMEAEIYAKNYVNAYFLPYGGKSQMVSSYLDPEEGDYFATFIVSEREGTPYETEVKIDGLTGKVSCEKECDYIK
jgi:hypothetical protein